MARVGLGAAVVVALACAPSIKHAPLTKRSSSIAELGLRDGRPLESDELTPLPIPAATPPAP